MLKVVVVVVVVVVQVVKSSSSSNNSSSSSSNDDRNGGTEIEKIIKKLLFCFDNTVYLRTSIFVYQKLYKR